MSVPTGISAPWLYCRLDVTMAVEYCDVVGIALGLVGSFAAVTGMFLAGVAGNRSRRGRRTGHLRRRARS